MPCALLIYNYVFININIFIIIVNALAIYKHISKKMNDESGQEKGEVDKKIVHVYPLIKVKLQYSEYTILIH